jgi:hypothetical protein
MSLFSSATCVIAIRHKIYFKIHKKNYRNDYKFSTWQILLRPINHIKRESKSSSCDIVVLHKNGV